MKKIPSNFYSTFLNRFNTIYVSISLISCAIMAKLDAISDQLKQWKFDPESSYFTDHYARYSPAIGKLPKALQEVATAVFNLREETEDDEGIDEEIDDDLFEKKLEAETKRIEAAKEKFDKLSAKERKQIFAVIAPQMADSLEATWQSMKEMPYLNGACRPFRAPGRPEATLGGRLIWLNQLAHTFGEYKPEALTPAWLARWSQHAFQYRAYAVVPILVAVINQGGKEADEVFDILCKSMTREDSVGIVANHVIQSLMQADRPEGWELIEKTLLAAQRQEGLRQSILSDADCAHPEAFRRMLRLIIEQDLIRFSSVARSINLWLGLLWDSASAKVLSQQVESILTMLESEAERKTALAGDDAEKIYHALWASACDDAVATTTLAAKLLKHPKDEVRFIATWVLTLLRLEPAEKARATAIDDPNLQVALMAAVSVRGISLENIEYHALEEHRDASGDRFERLEKLYTRLPEKPQTLKAIVWPWTERKIERVMITGNLFDALGDRPPTRMLPYLKALTSWQQRSVITMLAAQKKWDTLTRSTLFELVGHASMDVREVAMNAVAKQKLKPEEFAIVEGYLTRQAADLRGGVVKMILKCKDDEALQSADRLLAKGDRKQRLAGLELLRQLAEADRQRPECQLKAKEYQAKQKKLSKEEETQLAAISDTAKAKLTLDDALGLMNPEGRSKVVQPRKQSVTPVSKAAIACIKSLDDLIHEHRTTMITVKQYTGTEERPLGEVQAYLLPGLDPRKPLASQVKKLPLWEVWQQWLNDRKPALKDKDGLELLRAMFALDTVNCWQFNWISNWCKKSANKKLALAVLGELDLQKVRYGSLIERILLWLFYTDVPKGSTDFLLDCVENSYAHVPEEMHKELVKLAGKQQNYWSNDKDWRDMPVFNRWTNLYEGFANLTKIKLSTEQQRRAWELRRFMDEPCPGALRKRPSLDVVANAYQKKFATYDDLVDLLLGPDDSAYSSFNALRQLTHHPLAKQTRLLLESTPKLPELVEQIRSTILEIELARGEATTAATKPALALCSLFGCDTLFRVMQALDKGKLKVEQYWRDNAGQSRNAALTHLLKITYPAETDTPETFKKLAKQAIADGYCSEDRLLQIAFLAPQWSKSVGETLGWDGFSEGLYWFLAHMDTWHSNATQVAAQSEGINDEDPDVDEDLDDILDDLDDDEEDEAPAQPKEQLSAWERLVRERTPLTAQERSEGAVDVAWFHRTFEQLGEAQWKQMAQAAKFAANSAQANKAQFLADVLLGNKPKQELVDSIQKKFRKDHVRLLGLLPLEKGAKQQQDVIDRYEVLQGYKKYARGLSSLSKPDAMRAVEIGMNNLARLAGYPDPLRMEWALEAASIQDLARGPVSVTRDNVTVTLLLDGDAKPQISVEKNGKKLKAIPAPLKKKHADVAELAERAADLRKKASRMKGSLENAMCRGDTITAAELVQLFQHPILAPQLAKLVLIGDGIAGYPDKGGKALRDYNGTLEPVKKNETLRIAHPTDLFARGDWDKWQHDCFRAERIQPFKQIFRELYLVTKQEKKDGTKSNRFAGQQVGPKQAMALWGSRGWHTQEGVYRVFHDLSLIVEVDFLHDAGTASEVEGLTIDSVQFRKRDLYKPIKLSDIPPAVFSEVMRDMDLVVSVAHRGEVDPEASASTVEMRSALIRETCQLLGMKNVQLKNNHALIQGVYGEYSLHLGSGTIHRLPGGALTILPVHAQHRGRLFLPFADDDPRTAEVISKVLLLARDEEIMDPLILEQLGAPIGQRQALKADAEPATTGKTIPAVQPATPETAVTTSGKRYFEFREGKSQKFWEIEINGNSVTTRWGRIGSNGQSKTKEFADSDKAQAEYDKLIQEKQGKGYVE